MNKSQIAAFKTRVSAVPLQERLVEQGIPAEIHDELKLEKFWFASKPESGVRLEVPSDRFDRAHSLLLQWDAAADVLRDAIRCPECRSLRVAYPQFARNSLLPNLVVGLFAAIARVNKEFYCDDCHCTWPKEGAPPSRLRPNMSPDYFIERIEPTPARSAEGGFRA